MCFKCVSNVDFNQKFKKFQKFQNFLEMTPKIFDSKFYTNLFKFKLYSDFSSLQSNS